MNLNYRYCTLEELVDHLMGRTSQAITQQITYYTSRGDEETVKKIKKARLLVKQKKLQAKVDAM